MIERFVFFIVLEIVLCNGFNINQRIINGVQSQPFAYPFFVSISTSNPGGGNFFCGGTLISDTWVLTAAHCIVKGASLNVYLGIFSNGKFAEVYVVEPENQYIHPNFISVDKGHDICLLKLPEPIEFADMIHPVELPTDCDNNIYMENVITIGRGWTSYKNYTGDRYLRVADLITFSMHDCQQYAAYVFDVKSVICAYSTKGQTVYSGDSGGPMLLNNELIGVTSYTQEYKFSYMGYPFTAQTFTKVHYYFNWISKVTGLRLPHC